MPKFFNMASIKSCRQCPGAIFYIRHNIKYMIYDAIKSLMKFWIAEDRVAFFVRFQALLRTERRPADIAFVQSRILTYEAFSWGPIRSPFVAKKKQNESFRFSNMLTCHAGFIINHALNIPMYFNFSSTEASEQYDSTCSISSFAFIQFHKRDRAYFLPTASPAQFIFYVTFFIDERQSTTAPTYIIRTDHAITLSVRVIHSKCAQVVIKPSDIPFVESRRQSPITIVWWFCIL